MLVNGGNRLHVRAQWRVRQFDVVLCCRDGLVSIQEYMAFMISRETENVQSAQDVEAAFRALTSSDRPYITSQELYAVSHRRHHHYYRRRPRAYSASCYALSL